jgi:TRAP-type C4-dicarboxylate transport system permease small subunit
MHRKSFDRLEGIIDLAMRWGSVTCLVGIFILIAAGIFVRFVPISSMGWADEIVEFGFAWMVFLGSALLWKERTHFRVDFIPIWMAGTQAGRILDIILGLMSLFFFLVFTYEGGVLTMRTTDPSPILALPKALWYVIMPISGALLIGYTIRDLVLLFRGCSLSSSQ